ncbi:hypothetical protein AMK59_8311 [Oryctes borbonicus]|uniref:Lipase domain-containing protein n=1 Tax=Oryctes borbonicus TaxID=1629725 RepID=A0A0T6AZ85_9SCAR|nr:hypothetical protein AMK59_8311 [Oryctes borbonicus]
MVDIVHTDDGLFGCAGLKGTVNFYPNGGTALQPGCSLRVTLQDVLEAIKTIFVEPLPKVFCSHRKSVAFYIKSINEKNLTAYKCPSSKSYAKMQCNDKNGIPFGEDTPPNASGNYYIKIIK